MSDRFLMLSRKLSPFFSSLASYFPNFHIHTLIHSPSTRLYNTLFPLLSPLSPPLIPPFLLYSLRDELCMGHDTIVFPPFSPFLFFPFFLFWFFPVTFTSLSRAPPHIPLLLSHDSSVASLFLSLSLYIIFLLSIIDGAIDHELIIQ